MMYEIGNLQALALGCYDATFKRIQKLNGNTPVIQLVFDNMAAQPEIIHHHVECVIFGWRRIPLEVFLDLI